MRFYIFTYVGFILRLGFVCLFVFFIYKPLRRGLLSVLCHFIRLKRGDRKRHFSIFELLKSSFIEREVSDVINYILIHVNSFKLKTFLLKGR